MYKESLMIDKKKPKVTILNFYCPKMDDMNQNFCDIIKMLKCEKGTVLKKAWCFFSVQKGVLQDGKTIQTGYFC